MLLVEGPHDVRTVQQFLRAYGKDHEIVLLPLGGAQSIKGTAGPQLEEIKRISPKVSALIDSERSAPGEKLARDRVAFKEACSRAGVDCHVLELRAIENYLSDRAVKSVWGSNYQALQPFELLRSAKLGWGKSDNWRIAREMTRQEFDGTDLGEFLESL